MTGNMMRVVNLSRHGYCYRAFFWDSKLTSLQVAEGRNRWKTLEPTANSSVCLRAIELFKQGSSREYQP